MLTRRTLLASAMALPWAAHAAPPALDDTLAPGFARAVVIRWGDRVEADSPPFTPLAPTPAAAGRQFGWDAIVLGVLPVPAGEDGVPRALLAMAHPTADAAMMLPPGVAPGDMPSRAQGASIVNLERHGADWLVTDGGYQSRRLSSATLCRVTGPMATATDQAAQGVLGLGAGGVTPWATVLAAENLPTFGQANPQSYGWVVEIDPFDPQAMPTKRTALGRFARAGLAIAKARDGRAVVFMSDDRAAGHLFRFVSADPVGPDSRDVLDSGTLSFAVLDGYTLRWVAMHDPAQSTPEAAGRAGAARFDAPAGLAVDAQGNVLLACRGTATGIAPSLSNFGPGRPEGQVLILRPTGGDVAAEVASAEIGLIGGDTGLGGAVVSHPAALAVGADGRIWVAGDGSGIAVISADFGPPRAVYLPPIGAVMGGFGFSPDHAIVYSAVRHPGATPHASFEHPATRWPLLRADTPPQTTVVALTSAR